MKWSILSIKWGKVFSSEQVNILHRAARANCSTDFDFVCLTDDSSGLDNEIISHPIPMSGLKIFQSGDLWRKICLFNPELCEFLDRVLYLDLDTVIVGNIDDFFKDPGQSLHMLNTGPRWRRFDESLPAYPASGVMVYRIEPNTIIFDKFKSNPEKICQRYKLEQEFVGDAARSVEYFPLQWIQSFKYHLRRQYVVDLFLPPKNPASDTKIVAFHGYPRPSQVAENTQRWARFPRSGLHRPSWMQEYWSKYSAEPSDHPTVTTPKPFERGRNSAGEDPEHPQVKKIPCENKRPFFREEPGGAVRFDGWR